MAALIKIGAFDLPDPASYDISLEPMDKAERNARGDLIKEHINDKVKINLSWSYLPADVLATVLTAVKPNFFTVTYIHPETNVATTGTFYASPRSIGMIDYKNSVPRYKDIKFNLIEK